ncbi:MAG: carbamoyl phosphate synthase small subunit, partial [Clostridia bacterium]|nr:carbamoyl phosphate synthase small subunit [Clostridia bacterium]
RCEGTLGEYLEKNGVVGICGIDTRALTRILREEGTMCGMISDCGDVTSDVLDQIKSFKIEKPVKSVSRQNEKYTTPLAKQTVALYDFGTRKGVIDNLLHLDCNVSVFNCEATAEEILATKPDGILISDGPGDPGDNQQAIAEIKKLFDKKIPMFGIGLGHELMALALGADTFKLPYGHRGASGPCKNLETGVLSIITQNHGYCVVRETLPECMSVSHENANDKTIEGIVYKNSPAFSCQFRPDAGTSPTGEKSLYVKFTELCKEVNFNAVK